MHRNIHLCTHDRYKTLVQQSVLKEVRTDALHEPRVPPLRLVALRLHCRPVGKPGRLRLRIRQLPLQHLHQNRHICKDWMSNENE
jgi:hypothetical protein